MECAFIAVIRLFIIIADVATAGRYDQSAPAGQPCGAETRSAFGNQPTQLPPFPWYRVPGTDRPIDSLEGILRRPACPRRWEAVMQARSWASLPSHQCGAFPDAQVTRELGQREWV